MDHQISRTYSPPSPSQISSFLPSSTSNPGTTQEINNAAEVEEEGRRKRRHSTEDSDSKAKCLRLIQSFRESSQNQVNEKLLKSVWPEAPKGTKIILKPWNTQLAHDKFTTPTYRTLFSSHGNHHIVILTAIDKEANEEEKEIDVNTLSQTGKDFLTLLSLRNIIQLLNERSNMHENQDKAHIEKLYNIISAINNTDTVLSSQLMNLVKDFMTEEVFKGYFNRGIDSDYIGEIKTMLVNSGAEIQAINKFIEDINALSKEDIVLWRSKSETMQEIQNIEMHIEELESILEITNLFTRRYETSHYT